MRCGSSTLRTDWPTATPVMIVSPGTLGAEASMHTVSIQQSVLDRVVARTGREHVYDDLDPAKTALVVVDMQNAFMLPGVAHALCPMAEKIVPNVNRLAEAVRATGIGRASC